MTSPDPVAGLPGSGGDRLISEPGRSPVLDAAELAVLRGYGSERDVRVGDLLFADGDENYDLIVLLTGTADIVKDHGHAGASVIASYGPSQFLGEIGVLTGQRAFLSAVATSPGRVLAVPVEQLRRVMTHEPALSDLLLRTLLQRHSILLRQGTGLTMIGSRFDPDTRRLLEVLARNRLVWTWLDLDQGSSHGADQRSAPAAAPTSLSSRILASWAGLLIAPMSVFLSSGSPTRSVGIRCLTDRAPRRRRSPAPAAGSRRSTRAPG